jgi:hypothetical protein
MADDVKTDTTAPASPGPSATPVPASVKPVLSAAPEPAPSPPAEPAPPSPKERIQEIAAALTKASPSGVEALAGELASLAESL